MQVFSAEKKAGLESLLTNQANASIKYDSSLVRYSLKPSLIKNIGKAIANMVENDLYPLNSVMVTAGWNKNDDVFTKANLWPARNTPEDKPLNSLHNNNNIVGHIIGCYAVDDTGELIADDSDINDVPDIFHIIANSVVYKECWQDKEKKEQVHALIAEIEEALQNPEIDPSWYVSMECLFSGFDYAVADKNGEQYLVERAEESAFLTQHLRAYGGTGFFGDYKVGRAVKNIVFSGLGLVHKPANKDSIIFSGVLSFRGKQSSNINELMETAMANENETKTLDVLAAEYKAKFEAQEKQMKELNGKIDSLEATVKTKNDEVKELNTKLEAANKLVDETKAQVKTAEDKFADVEKTLAEIQAEKVKNERVSKFVEKGFTKEEAEQTVAGLVGVDEKVFATVLALAKPEKKEEKQETSVAGVLEGAKPNTPSTPSVPSKTAEQEKAEAAELKVKNQKEISDFIKARFDEAKKLNKRK